MTAAVDQAEGNRSLWVSIRTFSPLHRLGEERGGRARLKLCLISFTWRYKMEEEEEEEAEAEAGVYNSTILSPGMEGGYISQFICSDKYKRWVNAG